METLRSNGHAPPRLSVIVPVRDGAVFLAQSLPALRASDLAGDAWELIVVDDASRDGSAEIAGQFADLGRAAARRRRSRRGAEPRCAAVAR